MRSRKTPVSKPRLHGAKPHRPARETASSSRSLKPREAAREAGIGETNFYRMLQRGEVPHLKVGNRFVIPRAAFYRWLDNCGRIRDMAG
jgi:excisionase family DNA binding protein